MNWRSLAASTGAILVFWGILEMLYFGAIRSDGACAGSQFETASACYNTWGYTISGFFIGLTLLLVGMLSSPATGRGFQAALSVLLSLAVVPFVVALIYFNLQTVNGLQYVVQFPEVQYRLVFILEGLSLVGAILFALVYWTFRYTRKTVHQVIAQEAPKQIMWAGEEALPEDTQE